MAVNFLAISASWWEILSFLYPVYLEVGIYPQGVVAVAVGVVGDGVGAVVGVGEGSRRAVGLPGFVQGDAVLAVAAQVDFEVVAGVEHVLCQKANVLCAEGADVKAAVLRHFAKVEEDFVFHAAVVAVAQRFLQGVQGLCVAVLRVGGFGHADDGAELVFREFGDAGVCEVACFFAPDAHRRPEDFAGVGEGVAVIFAVPYAKVPFFEAGVHFVVALAEGAVVLRFGEVVEVGGVVVEDLVAGVEQFRQGGAQLCFAFFVAAAPVGDFDVVVQFAEAVFQDGVVSYPCFQSFAGQMCA